MRFPFTHTSRAPVAHPPRLVSMSGRIRLMSSQALSANTFAESI